MSNLKRVRPTDWPAIRDTTNCLPEVVVGEKRFVFLLDFEEDVYSLIWRQFDGDVRQAGPLRVRTTADRSLVGKELCLAIQEDFAPVAVVVRHGDDEATVEFRGEAWQDRLAQHIQPGCVLRLLAVEETKNGKQRIKSIENTLLILNNVGRRMTARVESNKSDPFHTSGATAGFFVMKVATQQGSLQIRLVDAQFRLQGNGNQEDPARRRVARYMWALMG